MSSNGILTITGGHRTMTLLRETEFIEFGESTFARVPMTVADDIDMPAGGANTLQHTELLPSLAWQFGVDWCRSSYSGNFLKADPEPPRAFFHARGNHLDRVDVVSDMDQERVAAWINLQRDDETVAQASIMTSPWARIER